ncbi:hypothetical protein [Nocardia sp. NPDC050175]|uniref:hypothetical protein n=1 Tax=Nocardia sp. NPDC050175 TaxID=3364317 RepID=UPI0037AFFDB4
MRILPPDTPADYDPTRLSEPAEQQLTGVIARLDHAQDQPLPEWGETATPLAQALRAFFDDLLVIADEPALRSARLGLSVVYGFEWISVASKEREANRTRNRGLRRE